MQKKTIRINSARKHKKFQNPHFGKPDLLNQASQQPHGL